MPSPQDSWEKRTVHKILTIEQILEEAERQRQRHPDIVDLIYMTVMTLRYSEGPDDVKWDILNREVSRMTHPSQESAFDAALQALLDGLS